MGRTTSTLWPWKAPEGNPSTCPCNTLTVASQTEVNAAKAGGLLRLQVRNSAGGIVQLAYGEDNLDPVAMEDAGGKPINLPRSLSVVQATLPQQSHIPENAAEEGAKLSCAGQWCHGCAACSSKSCLPRLISIIIRVASVGCLRISRMCSGYDRESQRL